jgi:4-hydroxy-2-oxoglutarate aldolase
LIAANGAVTARFGVAGRKAAMEMVGFYGGPPRSPLQPLNNEQSAILRGMLKEAGIL